MIDAWKERERRERAPLTWTESHLRYCCSTAVCTAEFRTGGGVDGKDRHRCAATASLPDGSRSSSRPVHRFSETCLAHTSRGAAAADRCHRRRGGEARLDWARCPRHYYWWWSRSWSEWWWCGAVSPPSSSAPDTLCSSGSDEKQMNKAYKSCVCVLGTAKLETNPPNSQYTSPLEGGKGEWLHAY